MTYTISQAAEMTGLSIHTLRYYEKEGLLPYLKRTKAGIRAFGELDMAMLSLINCLKSTGMQLREIRTFIDWYQEGDATLRDRLELFRKQKRSVERQMRELKEHLKKIDAKIHYYEVACAAGTERACDGLQDPFACGAV